MKVERNDWSSIWDDQKAAQMLPIAAQKLQLPADCVQTLENAQQTILADSAAYETVKAAAIYLLQAQEDACQEQLRTAAEMTGIHKLTVTAVMLVLAIPMMQQGYEDNGLPIELMWDTLIDVRCKLQEEYDCSGVWGTCSVGWYVRLYRLGIIKLGRLEFEPIGYKWDTPYQGIQKGDPVMNMHIPSTGPMKIEDVLDAFKRAYKFHGYTEPMPVAAASWLLYPPICEEVFKAGSNLKNFYELFDVVEQYEDPKNKNFWRIFNMDYEEGVLDRVPTDNSLRRGIYEFMKSGRHMGVGRCMLLFDGEKVTSK